MKTIPKIRPLPDHLRRNWAQAYQHWFVNPPTPIHISDMERLQRKAGVTDELIVAVMEKALNTRRLNVMAWVKTVIQEMAPFGVTTPEQWQEFEAERQAREEQVRERAAAAKQERKQQSGRTSNVFLSRDELKSQPTHPRTDPPFREDQWVLYKGEKRQIETVWPVDDGNQTHWMAHLWGLENIAWATELTPCDPPEGGA